MRIFDFRHLIIDPLLSRGWIIKVDSTDRRILYLTSPNGEFCSSVKFISRLVTEQGRKTQSPLLRMQLPEFSINHDGKTVLLGWSPEHEVFVAWNANLHTEHGKSPMLSCSTKVLELAAIEGIYWGQRKNKRHSVDENYVSFTMDFLPEYLMTLDEILNNEFIFKEDMISENEDILVENLPSNDEGSENASIDNVESIDKEEFSERIERRRIFNQKIRDYRFRKRILKAYDNTCAITRTKIVQILQAAHIVSVADGGNDSIKNGILLSANHHLLFDAGLLSIEEDFTVSVAPELELEPWYLDFKDKYDGRLLLPKNEIDRPNPEFLKRRKDIFRE